LIEFNIKYNNSEAITLIEHNGKVYISRIEVTLDYLGGKWKTVILYLLSKKIMRFNELKRETTGITHKMLTQQLKELERDGLINRNAYDEIPPKVEYSLTKLGESLIPILNCMCQWAADELGIE
jgi:DNA-binding HxlR family transcriptional regulator